MKNYFTNKYLLLIARFILGAIFIFAGMEKISDPSGFAKAIYDYKLFPEVLINLFAIVIPWIEIVSGLLLVFGIMIRENALIITSLLILFMAIVVISIFRGLNIECGCFGTASGSKVGWQKFLENMGLVILGTYIMIFENRSLQWGEKNV